MSSITHLLYPGPTETASTTSTLSTTSAVTWEKPTLYIDRCEFVVHKNGIMGLSSGRKSFVDMGADDYGASALFDLGKSKKWKDAIKIGVSLSKKLLPLLERRFSASSPEIVWIFVHGEVSCGGGIEMIRISVG